MKAIRLHETGGPEVLRTVTLPDPTPGRGQVVVEVAAAGVNFIDTYHRSGAYPLELPSGLGLEGAGTVAAVGSGVTGLSVGDRVAWADARGSYAQQLVLPSDRAVPVPRGLDLEQAAAVMLQGMTAHYLSHATWPLSPGDTALVYAAAGGVGRLLVQMAEARGARVLACTSTAAKEAEVRALGADEVIRYRDVDIVEEVRRLTDGRGVDVVYDSVGRDTFDASLASLRPRGMMVLFGQASGPVPPVDPQRLNRGGSLFLTRPSLGHYTATAGELRARAEEVLKGVASGALDVRIHARYPLGEVAAAHVDLEAGGTMGKLLIVP